MSVQELIFAAIRAERKAQDDRWGAEHDPGDSVLLAVLMEEVGEVARELNDDWPAAPHWKRMRGELIQVAAVAVRWVELLEEGNGRQPGIR